MIDDYQRLLLSEWNKDLPKQVLQLLWRAIAPGKEENLELMEILNPASDNSAPPRYFERIFGIILDGSKVLRLPDLPELPAKYPVPERMTRMAWLGCRLASYLTLPSYVTLEGDASFLCDLQSIAFQAALHYVLPGLRKEKRLKEHSILLHSASLYAMGYYSDDPAHCAYLFGSIYGYLNVQDRRMQSLYASFRFTSPRDHSYLTKAQELWMELLDERKFDEAENFLFSLHWWAMPDQREEVRQMIVVAIKYILKQRDASA